MCLHERYVGASENALQIKLQDVSINCKQNEDEIKFANWNKKTRLTEK